MNLISRLQNLTKIILINVVIFFAIFVPAELIYRSNVNIYPHGGIYTDADGNIIKISNNIPEKVLRPNIEFVHKSSEFSAEIASDKHGYRKVTGGIKKPHAFDWAFVGDSFTFGHGIETGKTFIDIVCSKNNLSCLNLGLSGSSQFMQHNIVNSFIAEYPDYAINNWAFILTVSCNLNQAGNDLGQNQNIVDRNYKKIEQQQDHLSDSNDTIIHLLKSIRNITDKSMILKKIATLAANTIRSQVFSCSSEEKLKNSITITDDILTKISNKIKNHNNNTNIHIFLVSAFAEIENGGKSLDLLQSYSIFHPHNLMSTFKNLNSGNYFFPYDGHMNEEGHKILAKSLSKHL
jgi:hypothetical protein